MITTSDFTKGTIIKLNGAYYEIGDYQSVNMGRRATFTRTTLKNLENGKILQKSFRPGEELEDIEYDKRKAVFLYKDRKNAVFLIGEKKERVNIPLEAIDDKILFLKENIELDMIFAENKCLTITLPPKVELKVTQAPPAMKGNTAGAATKTVILETGLEVTVPEFINEDDIIRVNTETKKYSDRV